MKLALTLLLLAFSSVAISEPNCQNGDITSLTETWKAFRRASLHATPEKIVNFYKFPLKLYSPTDPHGIDEKPIIISRNVFLKNYQSIFQQTDLGEETAFYKDLKASTGDESVRRNEFDNRGCNFPTPGPINVEYYDFVWSEQSGWQIESISYIGYADLMSRYKPGKLIK